MPQKILVIDDEKELAEMTRLRLIDLGYVADAAFSGTEGVFKALNDDFDLVITDYNMPDISGEEVLDSIRIKKPNLPVAIFSIYHDDDVMLSPILRKKAAGVVMKPIDENNLRGLLEKVFPGGFLS